MAQELALLLALMLTLLLVLMLRLMLALLLTLLLALMLALLLILLLALMLTLMPTLMKHHGGGAIIQHGSMSHLNEDAGPLGGGEGDVVHEAGDVPAGGSRAQVRRRISSDLSRRPLGRNSLFQREDLRSGDRVSVDEGEELLEDAEEGPV